jgi:hypothetical protein
MKDGNLDVALLFSSTMKAIQEQMKVQEREM